MASKANDREYKEPSADAAFTETAEFGHDRNMVAKAEKEAASQETAGVMDPE